MRTFVGDFDKLYFTGCSLGKPLVSGDTLRIPVLDLFALKGHPLRLERDGPYSGWLVFSGVTHSSRTVSEYIGGPKAPDGFKEPYSSEDGPFPAQTGNLQNEYGFEGSQLDPGAWLDNWIVKATSFQLLIE